MEFVLKLFRSVAKRSITSAIASQLPNMPANIPTVVWIEKVAKSEATPANVASSVPTFTKRYVATARKAAGRAGVILTTKSAGNLVVTLTKWSSNMYKALGSFVIDARAVGRSFITRSLL